MALYRQPPKCIHCGATAEGVYQDQSHLPDMLKIIGDTFMYWKPLPCNCPTPKITDMMNLFKKKEDEYNRK